MSLPRKKNFLRDILPKHGGENFLSIKDIKNKSDVIYQKVTEPIVELGKNRGNWRIWLLAVGAVLALTVVLLYALGKVEVVITPRVDEFSFNNDFKAKKDSGIDEAGTLNFSVIPIEKIGTKNVTADGQKLVEKKASGAIIIYNNYSNKEQKLIRNTRFQTVDGLIFRIDRSVVIPPMAIVSGKTVAGSVEAVVYADEVGVKYNIGPTSFTIPGFKSDPKRYAGFYARSEAPMLDGYSGMASYLTDTKQKLVRLEIRSELEKQILAEADLKKSAGSFVPKNAYTLEFESLPISNGSNGQVTVKEKAKMLIYSFNTENWDSFLSKSAPFSSAIGSSTVRIGNRDGLVFTWLSRPKADSPEISFHIKGGAKFVWNIDQAKVANSLAGKKRGELVSILSQFNEIANATASIFPFWKNSFPADLSKIRITIVSLSTI